MWQKWIPNSQTSQMKSVRVMQAALSLVKLLKIKKLISFRIQEHQYAVRLMHDNLDVLLSKTKLWMIGWDNTHVYE